MFIRPHCRVSQSSVIKLLQEVFNDAERSGIVKDETILLQNLHLFLQHHQDLLVRNVIYSQEPKEGKKVVDFPSLSNLFYQLYHTSDTSVDKSLAKKRRISSRELTWIPSAPPAPAYAESFPPMGKSSRNARPGKPTVLTLDEEAILANFILQLEEKQIRLPRDDVRKLVMGMLASLGRPHPFKQDGPHRHWFKGFYKRNPLILQTRSSSSPVPREQLKDNQIQQFLDELKRLDYLKAIPYAAHNLHLATLDENGYRFSINQDLSVTPPAVANYMQTTVSSSIPPPPPPPPSTIPEAAGKEDKPGKPSWTVEQLSWAVDQVNSGLLSVKDASERTCIPIATVRNHCRNPNMGARRGPPTVLTELEELALERFLLKLDDCGFKANKEELGKLVMELVTRDKRDHPFKEDGPHRHWYQVRMVQWNDC